MENLRRFFDAEEIAHKKLEEVQEKAKHIHFPDDEIDKTSKNTADEALDLHKEWIAIQYDIIFGEGTFKKIDRKSTRLNSSPVRISYAVFCLKKKKKIKKTTI